MIERECSYWKTTAEKGKHYDCMISFKSEKPIKILSYLPFKSINEDSNSSVYRFLVSKQHNIFGYSSLQMREIEIPNEGKVMEVKDKSFQSNDTDTSSNIFTQKFDNKKLKEIRVREEINKFQSLPNKLGFVVVCRTGKGISLYDFAEGGKLEDDLDFTKEIMNFRGSGEDSYVIEKY